MPSPITFLLNHQTPILTLFRKNDRNIKKTWYELETALPSLSQVMRFNTFKQYITVFAVSTQQLDKVTQEKETVIQKLTKANAEKESFSAELDKVTHRLDKVTQEKESVIQKLTNADAENEALRAELDKVTQKLTKKPARIAGWTTQRTKEGYWRCYRKISGRVHSVYIGRHLDEDKAHRRIAEKEKQLGLPRKPGGPEETPP